MEHKFSYLPKIQSRRQPGVHRMGFASYFTDGNSEEIKLLKELNTNWETKVKELNEELAKKGATLGQIQKEVNELKAKGGQISFSQVPDHKMNMKGLLLKEWESAAEQIKSYRHDLGYSPQNPYHAFTTKAVGTMTTSANITGASISAIPTISNEWATRGRQLVHARDLIRTINTATGLFMYPRLNTPTGEGSVAATSAPGAVKNMIDYDVTMVTVNARYRAGIVDMAAEMEQDFPGMGEFITEELTEDYLRVESFDFFTALVTAATASSTLPGGVTVTAEKIPHWIANLEQQNYQATDLVVRPRLWATLLNTKPSDYSVPGGFVITPSGDILFAGLRLVKTSTNALSDTQVLIGDFRKAIIVQKAGEGFRVQMYKTHDKHVYQNIVTFRGEARAEIAITRPDAFLVGTA